MKSVESCSPKATLRTWEQELKLALRTPSELLAYLKISPHEVQNYRGPHNDLNRSFKTLVPRIFADKMQAANSADPLLRQVLPVEEEDWVDLHAIGDPLNPLQESAFTPVPGFLHKYKNRGLLITTGACAVHCRYCFRKNFPYSTQQWSKNFESILNYLNNRPEINEVILSGGDPLSLKDQQIAQLLQSLSQVPSLKTIRFHTRFPIVIPQRLTPELLAVLKQPAFEHLNFVMVLHCNHPSELDANLQHRIQSYRAAQVLFLNQSVLLKGINDDPAVLIDLSWALFERGVLPYYLHVLDPIAGTAHFRIPETMAQSIGEVLKAELPGYLVPKLVKEIPGYPAKYML